MKNIVAAFTHAASELGFQFEPWFGVELAGGRTIKALGLVRQFGSPNGTLVFSSACKPTADERKTLHEMGYFYSIVWPTYEQYEAELFRATLDDWQFFGSAGERPSWYTGKPWS